RGHLPRAGVCVPAPPRDCGRLHRQEGARRGLRRSARVPLGSVPARAVPVRARRRGRATVGDVRKDDVTAFTEAIGRRQADPIAALVARVDPNAPDRWSRTPLMMVAEFGDLALVAALVARGGDVDQKRTHLTPVTLAASPPKHLADPTLVGRPP